MIIFFGALIGLLFYLGVIQWIVEILGGAISWMLHDEQGRVALRADGDLLRPVRGAAGHQGLPDKLTRSELFAAMTAGFASVAGSTLVGYALLGAPLPYLLAASVMNAPASLYMAKLMVPETEESPTQGAVRAARDEESVNVIDATANGALNGGRIAVIVGAC